MSPTVTVLVLIWWTLCVGLTGILSALRGASPGMGCLFGALLGPLGLLASLTLPRVPVTRRPPS